MLLGASCDANGEAPADSREERRIVAAREDEGMRLSDDCVAADEVEDGESDEFMPIRGFCLYRTMLPHRFEKVKKRPFHRLLAGFAREMRESVRVFGPIPVRRVVVEGRKA